MSQRSRVMDTLSVENVTIPTSNNLTSTDSCSQPLYSHTYLSEDSCETKHEGDGCTGHYCSIDSLLPGISNETLPGESSVDPLFLKACRTGDEEELRQIIVRGPSAATINHQDGCGRVGSCNKRLNPR
ncbi:uncharacterized protein LOC111089358 [Limulus polyphemus]|uniref:Uncharacterized protein LOC111089358 n=1 Tax=Limulus polyphemus TaxID=6850 RepID=A0ABM1TNH9_LIMPO|nr:uncharacterized protein LOC111089358 [Limulus polyphemus]